MRSFRLVTAVCVFSCAIMLFSPESRAEQARAADEYMLVAQNDGPEPIDEQGSAEPAPPDGAPPEGGGAPPMPPENAESPPAEQPQPGAVQLPQRPNLPSRNAVNRSSSALPGLAAPGGRTTSTLPGGPKSGNITPNPPVITPVGAEQGITPAGVGRPTDGKSATEPVNVYFWQTELGEIVKAIGAQTGKNFLFDPQMGQTLVTLVGHAPIQSDMLLPLLQSVLTTYGFTMRESLDGNIIKIRPLNQDDEMSEMSVGQVIPNGFEEYSTHIVPVQFAKAEELANLLPSLGSAIAKVNAYGPTNTLIITDNSFGVRRMLEFISEVDIPGSEIVMEMFHLDYARAEDVAEQLVQVLLESESGGSAQSNRQVQPMRQPMRPVPGQTQQTIVSTEEPQLRVVPDERLNMVMVMATKSLMDQVRVLIDALDTPTRPDSNNMHVYNLKNADAETLAETLNALINGTTSSSSSSSSNNRSSSSSSSNRNASADQRNSRSGQQSSNRNSSGVDIQAFEKDVVIESYDSTNSLVVVATPQDYLVISELIEQLDRPQRQVHVESIIMEVVIDDSFELSTELLSLGGYDGFALNNIVNLGNLMANGPISTISGDSFSGLQGLTTGILDGTMTLPVSDGEGGWTSQEFPKIPVLLRALDTVTTTDVLSQPMLTTVDNEEASIVIGQEVPVTTGSQTSTNTDSTLYSNIERKDVGVKMTLTPQISQGDYVNLELEVEVSAVATATSSTGDVDVLGPTFTKSNVTNNVVIRDGSTGIVGGLIQDSRIRNNDQTPILGDIPVLGRLFGSKTDNHDKRNLVVLVTPTIVKDGVDSDRLTKQNIEDFQSYNMDSLFESGFIKKIKKRHTERIHDRPTENRIKKLSETTPELNLNVSGQQQ